jgi:hypothetical protein
VVEQQACSQFLWVCSASVIAVKLFLK